jgi:hypothetical protein
MLRKLNFTDRIRIPRNAVRIALRRDEDGVLAFDPTLELDAIEAPAHARVLIEAWYRNSYMRFDCGTVAELSIPESRRLVDIDSDRMARFRLKIVDGNRILAVADDIVVGTEQVPRGRREPLLPVNFRDLGDEVWRLEFEATGAVLELSNRVAGIEQMARGDGRFFSLVYPAAVRQVLTHILLVERYEPGDETDEWWSLWLRWAEELAGVPLPENEDERRNWIEEAARAFCARHQAVTRFVAAKGDET